MVKAVKRNFLLLTKKGTSYEIKEDKLKGYDNNAQRFNSRLYTLLCSISIRNTRLIASKSPIRLTSNHSSELVCKTHYEYDQLIFAYRGFVCQAEFLFSLLFSSNRKKLA